jgi:hypothetical protein
LLKKNTEIFLPYYCFTKSYFKISFLFSLIFLLFFLYPLRIHAVGVAVEKGGIIEDSGYAFIPYAFKTDSLGTAFGIGAATKLDKHPQSFIAGTIYGTSNDSSLAMISINNYRFSKNNRLFIDAFAIVNRFTDQRFYVDLDNDLSKSKAGSNDSSKDDFISGVSNEIQGEITLKYPLKMGNAVNEPVSIYNVDKGLLESGPRSGKMYNPLFSGKTILAGRLFYKYRDLNEVSREDLLTVNSSGIKLWLDHNNTDFPRNPSIGSRQKATITNDFAWLENSETWTNLDLELTKYINLGTSDYFRQQVLAVNFWTSNTLTWKTDSQNSQIVYHQPPPGVGSTLGGFDRLRAYPTSRFQDKAAVYYSAELRLISTVNYIGDISFLSYFEIDWLQLVAFVEAGRVGPDHNTDLFIKDLKKDIGLSLRLMAFRSVIRLDWAVSDEGSQIWAMYNQTFGR